jgi:hypothetical protein
MMSGFGALDALVCSAAVEAGFTSLMGDFFFALNILKVGSSFELKAVMND